MLARARAGFESLLEAIVIVLMVGLAAEVIVGVVFRTIGESLVWYDEVAAILLAWLTYYGSALAAMKRAHIGFSGLIDTMSPVWRVPAVLLAEFCVFGFFILLAYIGWSVMEILTTDYLVSLPEVSVIYTQSVIWIGAVLFIIAEALMLPQLIMQARRPGPMHPGPEINP
jgi:TRAP-type C4-dicarboxylate transport system permease small subunit